MLWAGISGELERLQELRHNVVSATSALGFMTEKRSYSPHLTLARKYRDERVFSAELLSNMRGLPDIIENNCSVKDWTVDAFVVYATRMHAIPMYEMIGKMSFF
ncbi:RNA 2',3'-cyclic phosphodiesterase [compost metagenome]